MESNVQDEKKEVVSELIGFDLGKLKNTVVDLTLRPGPAIAEFAQGDRSKYLTPITYYLLIFGFSFFLDSVTGVGEYVLKRSEMGNSFVKGIEQAEAIDGTVIVKDKAALTDQINTDVQSFMARREVQLLLMLPGLLLCQWLFFRHTGKSFLHNAYFALFTMSQYVLLVLPFYVLFYISRDIFYFTNLTVSLVVPVIYCTYAGVGFYPMELKKLALRNVLLYASVIAISGILSAVLVISIAGSAFVDHLHK
ncbi:MAG: DUF3667 domain-containing protein [Cyclobacteriaceae bacterium]|jgi:hypothetical protein|nr:hypothetical protein [Cytophagales bacterium]HNP76062.1 DUF3667 domain-containing protein [Cyclobacteriaceae bacterium]